MRTKQSHLFPAFLMVLSFVLAFSSPAPAQIFGSNLIANGDAEAGPADSSGTSPVSTIPGWTRTGPLNMVNVLTYASGAGINTGRGDLAPFDGGNNYFNGFNGGASGTGTQMTQAIDLSPGAATIDGGNVTCALSGYIGGDTTFVDNAAVSVQFQDSGGKILSTVALPPVDITDRNGRTGMLYRRIVQQVPAGARTALVTVGFGASSLAKNTPMPTIFR